MQDAPGRIGPYLAVPGHPEAAGGRTSVAAVPDPYAAFETLTFDRSEPDVLQIVLDGPDLNAVGPKTHQELADVWSAVDRDPAVRVAVIRAAGRGSRPVGALSSSSS